MSWSYSGDPNSSPLDNLRFSVGDTESTLPILSNEELTFVLNSNSGNIAQATLSTIYVILAKYARLKDETVGGLQAKYAQIYDHYHKMLQDRLSLNAAIAVDANSFYCGGISVSDKDSNAQNTSVVQPKFTKDQNTSRFLQGQYDVVSDRYF